MNVPRNCRYTRDHFWVRPEGNEAVMGLSDHLQKELGDIVFVDLPELDDDIEAQGTFGIVESDLAVADLITPVKGTVTEISADLEDSPELINEDPYGEGWLIRVELDDPEQLDALMTPEEYEDYIADLGEEE
jgi:glycine cleavage system H protein